MQHVTEAPTSAPFTKAEWDLLPEGFPAQLVEGWLVREPAPPYGHQVTVVELIHRLGPHAPPRCVAAPVDVVVDDTNVYQPDVVVLHAPMPWRAREVHNVRIAFEVLSPSSKGRDRRTKLPRLLASGTLEVWLIDPFARLIERHDASGVDSARGAQAIASRALPGFALVPDDLFGPPEAEEPAQGSRTT
jgi:Uma2 family endonuclease